MKMLFEEIAKIKDRYIQLRRDIHQHPELGFEEQRTSDLVAQKLTELGYEVHRGLAKTGVVGTLKVGNGTKRLGLRADIDALPIIEASGKTWQSQTEGKFHGCGHDGHTAMLLCAAEYLAKTRQFEGTLHLIFQPAEELLYGGKVMIDDGLFDRFPCDAIFALHNMPGLKTGQFYFKKGAMMASSDTLHIHVNGVGSHGAMPEYGVDATLAACHIAIALQSIVSRSVTPFQPAVVTIGSIQSGEAPNVVNGKALLKLSVRALNNATRELMLQRITMIANKQAESFGASVDIEHINGSPVLMNDPDCTDFAINVATELYGADRVCTDTKPLMGSEDFAFMLEKEHGCYFMIGAGDDVGTCMVHNPGFDFNDDILAPGAAFWCALTEKYLK